MIVTVTLNAAIDRTLTVPNFQRGQRHRASDGVTLAGGKGINVARALKALGIPVVATGLIGGSTGTRIVEQLTDEAILNDFVHIDGDHVRELVVLERDEHRHQLRDRRDRQMRVRSVRREHVSGACVLDDVRARAHRRRRRERRSGQVTDCY